MPGEPSSRHRSGKPRYRHLDLADPSVQTYVRDTCVLAKEADSLRVRRRNTICVLDVFESDYLAPRGLELPLSRRAFQRHLATFANSNVLLDGSTLDHWLGVDCDSGRVTFVRDRYTLNVRDDASVDFRVKLFKKWRKFVDARAAARPAGATRPIMASDLEVMTSLEANIVRGSVVAALLSVAAAFVCVLGLTQALFHTCLILAVVVWQMALLVSFMTYCLRWPVGIIEAISLSIFVGVSVDYVLHVDQAYRFHASFATLGAPSSRLNTLKASLAEVGPPVFAAAATTSASPRPRGRRRERERASEDPCPVVGSRRRSSSSSASSCPSGSSGS